MVLQQILDRKKVEVHRAMQLRSVASLQERLKDSPPVRSLVAALQNPNRLIGLIAEVKKASPSAGVIRENFNHLEVAKGYVDAGADCLSILTDEYFFQGNLSFLTDIRAVSPVPLLRKDFIIDPYQIIEARVAGADAILLIVAALTLEQLREYHAIGRELGMDVLVETHSLYEMEAASSLEGVNLIGINSRNLKTFVTDLSIIEEIASYALKGSMVVAESAIKSSADVRRVVDAGAKAILVGETLMRAADLVVEINALMSF